KSRIEELVLNKEVKLEADAEDTDQYGRYLRYIFLDGKNINLQLVQEGLAVARFYPENIKYKQEIIDAEKQARENKTGCKWKD
ncbi:MAG TPA: thermonuclease family protein, partial [Candidatus Nanoarchaeia archaeon]|nr:thermonuclease family protein [Candidatus Nanoarchaeia archaeon]